jgi:hypothetical protein
MSTKKVEYEVELWAPFVWRSTDTGELEHWLRNSVHPDLPEALSEVRQMRERIRFRIIKREITVTVVDETGKEVSDG